MLTASQRVTALALVFAASTANSAFAQDTAADPDAPEFLGTETMPEMGPGRALRDAQDTVRGMVDDLMDQQGMMDGPGDGGMTSPGMMGQGMMCSEMCGGMMGSMAGMGMHGHALRVMFAIADANDDGGLSLEEIADIQARIFGAIDADDDGTMTPEELQAFMQE